MLEARGERVVGERRNQKAKVLHGRECTELRINFKPLICELCLRPSQNNQIQRPV